jgi:hypothetical protein
VARRMVADGLSQGLNHILLVARDQKIRAYREASRQQYERSGVVQKYRRIAAKNTRTCMACIALDGTVWKTSELMPLHPQDRCAMIPIVDGFKPVESDENAREWFRDQPEDVQREMMGPGKFEAWQDRKFRLNQLATVRENRTWGPGAQVTTLGDLLGT